ncbi:MAG: cytochrome P450 [Candidatus Limnocylindria bacterium]
MLAAPSAPRAEPVLGHLRAFNRDRLGFLVRCARDHGDVVPLRFGPKRYVLMSDPPLVTELLVERAADFRKGYSVRLMRPVLGNGLLLNEGEHWRARRRLIQPELQRERVRGYADLISRWTAWQLRRWSAGAVRDVYDDMNALTMGVATELIFGIDARTSHPVAAALRSAVREATRGRPLRAFPLARFIPTAANAREALVLRSLDRSIAALIAERRRSGPGAGILGSLLRSGDADPRQQRDDLVTLFFGAYDTTSNALAWALYLVGTHPEAWPRLAAEAADPSKDGQEGGFAEAIVLEALRLYPSAWAESREAIRACEVGGQTLARGDSVIVSQWVLHRDPRWFDEPERFLPERWLDGLADRLPRGAYFPFGLGPRRCVGASLAMLEAAMVLRAVARDWRPLAARRAEPVPEAIFTLRPRGGLPMRIEAP